LRSSRVTLADSRLPAHPIARFQARTLRLAGGIHERLAVIGEWTLEPASSVP